MAKIRVIVRTRYIKLEEMTGFECFNNCKLLGICLELRAVDISIPILCSRTPKLYVTNFTVLDVEDDDNN
jgi:hypothetical protein